MYAVLPIRKHFFAVFISFKKTKSARTPTPFLAFCSMYCLLLATATVAASAAAECYENRNDVAAGAAALEAVAAAKKQQQNDPQAIAAAGHSAFVEIVHIPFLPYCQDEAFLIPLLHNTLIAAKRLHRLTKLNKILIIIY